MKELFDEYFSFGVEMFTLALAVAVLLHFLGVFMAL